MTRYGLVNIAARTATVLAALTVAAGAAAQESYDAWPLLRSTFPSTGGGGFTIKGYDPVISAGKCITTFMAVEAGPQPKVYPNVVEFDAVEAQGGVLCQNGTWRAFSGGGVGTTPYRMFYKDGVFRGSP